MYEYNKNIYRSFRSLLDKCDKCFGASIAFLYKDRKGIIIKKTYSEFVNDVKGTSNWIYQNTCSSREQKIVVLSQNCYEYVVTLFACLCGAGIFVVIDSSTDIEKVIKTINKLDIGMLIVDDEYEDKIINSREEISKNIKCLSLVEESSMEKFVLKEAQDFEFCERNVNELHVIVATSGTTINFQKFVMLSATNLLTNIVAMNSNYSATKQKVLLSLTLSHLYSIMGNVVFPVSRGDEVFIASGIYGIESDLLEYNPTTVALVPLIADALLKKYIKLKLENEDVSFKSVFGTNFMELRLGGAVISPELLQGYHDLGVNIVRGYGLTEAATNITVTKPIAEENDLNTVGHVLPCNEVKIVDGEIWVRGKNIMLGYYNDEELTKETLIDGWLKTGDAGYLSDDGRLYITGRIKEIIVLSNGENLNPEEIEQHFLAVKDVDECAVFTIDDKELCMIVYAEKYLDNPKGILENVKKANKELPFGKQIGRFEISEIPLPKTSIGKIKRSDISKSFYRVSIINDIRNMILNRLYKNVTLGYDTDFKDELGLSSFDMFAFWCEIEDRYERKIRKNDFMKCRCIDDVCKQIIS